MRKVYRGSWSYPLGLLFPMLSGFGCGYFFIYAPIQRTLVEHRMPTSFLVVVVPFGILFVAMGFLCLAAILECFSTYTLDEEGIRKSGVLSRGEMSWSGVTSYRIVKGLSRKLALTDHMGRSMSVYLEMVSKSADLQQTIEQRLAELIKRQERDMFSGDRTFRPARSAGIAIGIFGLVSIIAGIGAPAMYSGPQAQQALLLTALFVILGLPVVLLGIAMYTWQLYANDSEIGSRTVFGSTVIRYSQVTSAIVRDVKGKNGIVNTTSIYEGKKKISFNSQISEYETLRDYVMSHISPDARDRGDQSVPAVQKKEALQGVSALFVICLLGFGLMAAAVFPDAQKRIKLNDELDHRGRTVTGIITSIREYGGKSTTYYVYYAYPVGNKSFTKFSQISRDSYAALAESQPIQVTYLPDQPDVARVPQSIGRQVAERQFKAVFMFLGAAFVLPPIMYFVILADAKIKPRQRGAKQ